MSTSRITISRMWRVGSLEGGMAARVAPGTTTATAPGAPFTAGHSLRCLHTVASPAARYCCGLGLGVDHLAARWPPLHIHLLHLRS